MRGVASILAIILWLTTTGRGSGLSNQNLTGEILNAETGGPVVSADISLAGTGFSAVSDRFGRFSISQVPPGEYHLDVTRLGFEPVRSRPVIVTEGIPGKVRILLVPKPIPLDGHRVRAERSSTRLGNITVIDREDIRRAPDQSLAGLLQQVDGLFVESGRNPGEDLRVRIRGCDPDQVLLLLDGHRLNSSGDGSVAAAVPVEAIERIEVTRGAASARYGPDAMGGVINILTGGSQASTATSASIGLSSGRWDNRTGSAEIEGPLPVIRGDLRVLHKASAGDGDFPFQTVVQPQGVEVIGTRQNNHSESQSIYAGSRISLLPGSVWHASFHQYEADAGLPGRADAQSVSAVREDRRTLLGLEGNAELGNWNVMTRAGYSWQRQLFSDTLTDPISRYRSRFHTLSSDLTCEATRPVAQSIRAGLGMAVVRDRFEHEDLLRPQMSSGRAFRTTWSGYAFADLISGLPDGVWFHSLDIDLSLRHDRSHSRPEEESDGSPFQPARKAATYRETSPAVSLSLTAGHVTRIVVRGRAGESFRLPSLTSLFWFGDVRSTGNPDLRPERSTTYDLGIELSRRTAFGTIRLGSTFYRNELTDLVVWVEKSQSTWSPVNLGSALVTGHEDFAALELLNGDLTMRFGNTVTHPLNKVPGHNSFDRDLTFTPRFITTLSAYLERERYFVRYDIRRVARRYALPGNEKWYDGYTVHDLAIGADCDPLPRLNAALSLRIQNLFDEDYVLIANYPMPPRQTALHLKLTYHFERND